MVASVFNGVDLLLLVAVALYVAFYIPWKLRFERKRGHRVETVEAWREIYRRQGWL